MLRDLPRTGLYPHNGGQQQRIAELMGHAKPTLALAVYSSGLVPEQLRAAIDALDRVIEPPVKKHLRTLMLGARTLSRPGVEVGP